jgi:hypothetical protein
LVAIYLDDDRSWSAPYPKWARIDRRAPARLRGTWWMRVLSVVAVLGAALYVSIMLAFG